MTAELASRDVSGLEPSRRTTRSGLIDELGRYAKVGRFPRNRDFPGKFVPYFIDATGTRCAMAHLIESTGDRELVSRVAGTTNNARVRDLSGDRELRLWLARAGLTAAEAARIQPSYCGYSKAWECFCNSITGPVVLEGTVTATLTTSSVVATVDAIHGDSTAFYVGQEVRVYGHADVGDAVLIRATVDAQMMINSGEANRIRSDGTIELQCGLDVPALRKSDAIAAVMAGGGTPSDACVETLTRADSEWGESICKDSDGCSASATGNGTQVVFGAALLAATILSRRRARRRRALRNK